MDLLHVSSLHLTRRQGFVLAVSQRQSASPLAGKPSGLLRAMDGPRQPLAFRRALRVNDILKNVATATDSTFIDITP